MQSFLISNMQQAYECAMNADLFMVDFTGVVVEILEDGGHFDLCLIRVDDGMLLLLLLLGMVLREGFVLLG